jgi:hypothetical protein
MLLVALAFFAGDFDQCNCDLHPDAPNCQASGGGTGAPVACTGDGGYTGCISSPNPVGVPPPAPPPPPTAPAATTSRYMSTTDTNTLFNEGCAAGLADQNGIVILQFGRPLMQDGVYGTKIYTNAFAPVSDIEPAIESYMNGYYGCSLPADRLILAAGTSNDETSPPNAVGFAHGVAWAQMVNSLQTFIFQSGRYPTIQVAAADDIEPGFGSVADAEAWESGYASVATQPVYDNGSDDGCPTDSPKEPVQNPPNNGPCGPGWTQADEWYVASEEVSSFPLPQIYRKNGVDAARWQRISLYGALYADGPLVFNGALTQFGACDPDPDCSRSLDNVPAAGWSQLLYVLNSDPITWQLDAPPWSTDITKGN